MNFRVQRFDGAGTFQGGFGRHGDGSGDFAAPKGLATDRDGTVYVADSLFDTVQLFLGQGTFLLALGSRGTGSGEFWMPSGIAIGRDDRLYVCDTYNGRVQVLQLLTAAAGREALPGKGRPATEEKR
jgi:DNA-binding beta-propeller fold protein YncE